MAGYRAGISAGSGGCGVPGALFFNHLSDKFRNSKVKVILGLEIVAAAMLAFTVFVTNTTMLMVSLTLYGFAGKWR